jgi:hypothetical protein
MKKPDRQYPVNPAPGVRRIKGHPADPRVGLLMRDVDGPVLKAVDPLSD